MAGALGVSPRALASVEPVAPQQLQQNKVKAAFVLNIARFVSWPAEVVAAHGGQFTLCYYGEDVLGSAYDIIHQHAVNGRQLNRQWVDESQGVSSCDMLLLSAAGVRRYINAPLVPENTPLLVIADLTAQKISGQAYPGVHVVLVRKDSKLGFDINLVAAQHAGLKFSSRLLRLARIVGGET